MKGRELPLQLLYLESSYNLGCYWEQGKLQLDMELA